MRQLFYMIALLVVVLATGCGGADRLVSGKAAGPAPDVLSAIRAGSETQYTYFWPMFGYALENTRRNDTSDIPPDNCYSTGNCWSVSLPQASFSNPAVRRISRRDVAGGPIIRFKHAYAVDSHSTVTSANVDLRQTAWQMPLDPPGAAGINMSSPCVVFRPSAPGHIDPQAAYVEPNWVIAQDTTGRLRIISDSGYGPDGQPEFVEVTGIMNSLNPTQTLDQRVFGWSAVITSPVSSMSQVTSSNMVYVYFTGYTGGSDVLYALCIWTNDNQQYFYAEQSVPVGGTACTTPIVDQGMVYLVVADGSSVPSPGGGSSANVRLRAFTDFTGGLQYVGDTGNAFTWYNLPTATAGNVTAASPMVCPAYGYTDTNGLFQHVIAVPTARCIRFFNSVPVNQVLTPYQRNNRNLVLTASAGDVTGQGWTIYSQPQFSNFLKAVENGPGGPGLLTKQIVYVVESSHTTNHWRLLGYDISSPNTPQWISAEYPGLNFSQPYLAGTGRSTNYLFLTSMTTLMKFKPFDYDLWDGSDGSGWVQSQSLYQLDVVPLLSAQNKSSSSHCNYTDTLDPLHPDAYVGDDIFVSGDDGSGQGALQVFNCLDRGTATISGMVYERAGGLDTPRQGVRITFTGTGDPDNPALGATLIGYATSDANGNYSATVPKYSTINVTPDPDALTGYLAVVPESYSLSYVIDGLDDPDSPGHDFIYLLSTEPWPVTELQSLDLFDEWCYQGALGHDGSGKLYAAWVPSNNTVGQENVSLAVLNAGDPFQIERNGVVDDLEPRAAGFPYPGASDLSISAYYVNNATEYGALYSRGDYYKGYPGDSTNRAAFAYNSVYPSPLVDELSESYLLNSDTSSLRGGVNVSAQEPYQYQILSNRSWISMSYAVSLPLLNDWSNEVQYFNPAYTGTRRPCLLDAGGEYEGIRRAAIELFSDTSCQIRHSVLSGDINNPSTEVPVPTAYGNGRLWLDTYLRPGSLDASVDPAYAPLVFTRSINDSAFPTAGSFDLAYQTAGSGFLLKNIETSVQTGGNGPNYPAYTGCAADAVYLPECNRFAVAYISGSQNPRPNNSGVSDCADLKLAVSPASGDLGAPWQYYIVHYHPNSYFVKCDVVSERVGEEVKDRVVILFMAYELNELGTITPKIVVASKVL